MMISEISDEIKENMIDFMKLFYDGKIDRLHEYSDTEPDLNTYRHVKYLIEWFEFHKNEDYEMLKNSGISLNSLCNLKDSFLNLVQNYFFLPIYMQKPCSFNQFSIIYYKFHSFSVKHACDAVNISLNSSKPNFNEKYFVNHPNFQINNIYQAVPPTLSKIYKILDYASEQFEKIDMKNFIFTSHFRILSTFLEDIKNKNFSSQEIDELSYNWSVLFLKGFALSQISVKINQNECSSKNTFLSDVEFEQYLNICWRIKFSKPVLDNFDIHEDKLNEIYKMHQNDSTKNAIRPLIMELIPYYRKLISPEGLLKITIDKSNEYEPFMNKLNNLKKYKKANADQKLKFSDDFIIFNKYVYGLYLDRIPFKLINMPDESYMKLFRILLNRVNYSTFSCENQFSRIKPPCEELVDLVELSDNFNDDFQNQKYYITCYITKMLIQHQQTDKLFFTYANTNSAALMLSILPWEIPLNSEEARNLEKRLMDNIKISVKTRRLQSLLYHKWRKFIVKEIWDAVKPLNIKKMKKKINLFFDDSCDVM